MRTTPTSRGHTETGDMMLLFLYSMRSQDIEEDLTIKVMMDRISSKIKPIWVEVR
jgi:hypothetical protein